MSDKRTMQVEAIANGTVIDHIPGPATLIVAELIAERDDKVFIGMNMPSKKIGRKGVVKIADRELTPEKISRLALLAPGASMCIIRDYKVVEKRPIPIPKAFTGIATCPNGNCITNHEACRTRFAVLTADPLTLRCDFCERSFPASELSVRQVLG